MSRQTLQHSSVIKIVVIVVIVIVLFSYSSFLKSGSDLKQNKVKSSPISVRVDEAAQSSDSSAVNPYDYTVQPAPIGIADFGIGANNKPYEYNTSSFVGSINIKKLDAFNSSLGNLGNNNLTFQLNSILAFVNNGTLYNYWIQDVYYYNTTTRLLSVNDNIWNWSNPVDQNLTSSTVTGNGTIYTGSAPSGNVYIDSPAASSLLPGNCKEISLPRTISLRINSTLVSNIPEVIFQYNNGTSGWVTYDNAKFIFAKNVEADYGFVVNGNVSALNGLYYETDLIIGGPGDGTKNIITAANVTMKLDYANGNNYQSINNAYDFSGNTGEAVSNLTDVLRENTTSGQICAYLNNSGSRKTETNYPTSTLFQADNLSALDFVSSVDDGTLIVNSTSYQFVGNRINLTLKPGPYNVQLWQGSTEVMSGSYTLEKGKPLLVMYNEYIANFYEENLPHDTFWNVTVNGLTYHSFGTTIAVPLTTGSYTFSVGKIYGYSEITSSGSLTIGSSNGSIGISFFQSENLIAGALTTTGNLASYGTTASSSEYIVVTPGPSSMTVNKISLIFTGDGSFEFSIGTQLGKPQLLQNVSGGSYSFGNNFGWVNLTFPYTTLYGGGFYYLNIWLTSTSPASTNAFQLALNYTKSSLLLNKNSLSGYQVQAGTTYYLPYLNQYMFELYSVSYSVKFTETGLASNDIWYVNLSNSESFISYSSSFTLDLTNGTYQYNIATNNKIYHAPASSFTESAGSPSSISVSFSYYTYSVTFSESGLPSTDFWYVNITGALSPDSGQLAAGSSYSFSLINGTYQYNIATNNKIYHANAGSFPVNGASLTESVSFSYYTYSVTFSESGLPSTDFWYVNITGQTSSGAIDAGSSYSFSLINGTYDYTIATSNKTYEVTSALTSFTVKGSSVSRAIRFYELFTIKFIRLGIPFGTPWFVNISGQNTSGQITSSSYSILLINGTYNYTISTSIRTYELTSTSPSLTVNGASEYVSVKFSELFTVTLTEIGLQSSDLWYVNLSSGSVSGAIDAGSSYSFSLINGTYQYNIATNNKIYHAPASSFTESAGSPSSISVSFSYYTYSVTFSESGLPSGDLWYVNLSSGAVSGVISTPSYAFSLTNGSYNYNLKSEQGGYVAIQSTGQFNVTGGQKLVNVNFVGIGGKTRVNDSWVYLILGAVAVITTILVFVHRKKLRVFGVR